MQSLKKYLPVALFLGFLFVGIIAFQQSKPSPKNARIYKIVQQYSPYYLDKRFGGLQIMNRENAQFKEKPNNMTIFKEFERLERKWGKAHMVLEGNTVIIKDNNGTQKAKISLQTEKESDFVHHYYGL